MPIFAPLRQVPSYHVSSTPCYIYFSPRLAFIPSLHPTRPLHAPFSTPFSQRILSGPPSCSRQIVARAVRHVSGKFRAKSMTPASRIPAASRRPCAQRSGVLHAILEEGPPPVPGRQPERAARWSRWGRKKRQ